MQQPDTGQHHPPAPDYLTHDIAHLHPNPARTAHPLHHPGHGHGPPPPPLARPAMASSYSTTHALAQQRHQYPHQVQFHPQPQMHLQQHAPPLQQQQQQQDSRTQLFVSNLPFRARWQDLVRPSLSTPLEARGPRLTLLPPARSQKDLMRKCGTVLRADVALNPTDGRSRGFGVVLFAKADDAHKAIATYHGYTWQTRVLDVRIDAQDPTGALALAEANRQQAIQNQHKLLEQRARNSPVPPPPPPPPQVGLPYGAMLVPVPGVPGQAYLAAPPPPPPSSSAPGSESSPSPYLSPAVIRTSSQDNTSRRSPSPARSPSGPPSSASPASTLATPTDLSPGAAVAADPLLALGKRVTPPLAAPRSPTLHPPAPPRHHDYPQQQQQPPHDSGPHGYASQARAPDVPPQLQHALALVPPPPPPPMPMQVQVQLGPGGQPMLMPMVSIHPMGYAVPGGLVSYYAAAPPPHAHGGGGPVRPGSAPPHLMHAHGGPGGGGGAQGGPGYTNRHLFVGNLPFNCQWQELKDLMRGAGSVLRADIAQGPDGRSRGFGSVLFGTSQDAERAVGMFNGFEFNGRTLKVRSLLPSLLAPSLSRRATMLT